MDHSGLKYSPSGPLQNACADLYPCPLFSPFLSTQKGGNTVPRNLEKADQRRQVVKPGTHRPAGGWNPAGVGLGERLGSDGHSGAGSSQVSLLFHIPFSSPFLRCRVFGMQFSNSFTVSVYLTPFSPSGGCSELWGGPACRQILFCFSASAPLEQSFPDPGPPFSGTISQPPSSSTDFATPFQ